MSTRNQLIKSKRWRVVIHSAGVGAAVIDVRTNVDGADCQTSPDNGNQLFLSVLPQLPNKSE